ncbi:CsgG/HfaB family protein [Candidatus Moduliflexota bacterium]
MSTFSVSAPSGVRSFLPLAAGVFSLVLSLAACAPTARVVGVDTTVEPWLLPYHGPKARIAVAHFDDRTAKGFDRIGDGLATMFVTALVNSGRYIVLERDLIDEVLREQDLAAAGQVKAGTGAPVGEIEGADILLIGAVTEFEPDKFGLGGAVIGLGTLIGTAAIHQKENNFPIGAATYRESHIAIDLRLVDSTTSEILAAVSIESTGRDWGGGVIAEVGGGYTRMPFALGGFQKSAAEKAVRKAVNLGVSAITLQAPHRFFRHGDEDFASERFLGFTFLDIPGITGEDFPVPGIHVASDAGEWAPLAGRLGMEEKDILPPVDFSTRRVVLIAAGRQGEPGRQISVERVVAFEDAVEMTLSLTPPAPPTGKGEKNGEETASKGPSPLHPVALIDIEDGPPVRVRWK